MAVVWDQKQNQFVVQPDQKAPATGNVSSVAPATQAPASNPSTGGVTFDKVQGKFVVGGTPTIQTVAPAPQQNIFQKALGFATAINQPVIDINKKSQDFTIGLLNSLRKSVTDAVSGKDLTKIAQGNKAFGNNDPLTQLVGQGARKWFDTVGSKLYFNSTDTKEATDFLDKNPNYWDSLGSTFNFVSTPFLVKDVATAGARVLGKELPLPTIAKDAFSFINHAVPDALTTKLGKGIQNTFGKFSGENIAAHLPWAKEVFPEATTADLESQAGRHVIDWVSNMASKIQFSRGGEEASKLSNSDILQAWSTAKNLWGKSIQEVSTNMDKFAKTMNRVIGGVNDIGSTLGLDPAITEDLTLYTKDYMQAAKTAASKLGHASPSFVDQLSQILKAGKDTGSIARTDIGKFEDYIKAIKMVEKETGYKVGSGHASFVDPLTLGEIPTTANLPKIGAGTLQIPAKAVKQNPVSTVVDVFKGLFDPQTFSNDAKQALIQARFRTQLVKAGLDPVKILDKIAAERAKGISLPLSDAGSIFNRGKFATLFGEDAKKIIDAANEAGKIPFKISGASTAQLARRLPFTSPFVQALFGLRWRLNPVFQLAKLPTKLYEISAAEGIAPWSPEAAANVAHYVSTFNKPMIARIMDNMDAELQYQAPSIYGTLSKKFMAATADSPFVNQIAKVVDHITSADERVYAKAVYKYLGEHGADLSKIPVDQQLDAVIKNVPMDVIGAADNYAKTITRYGQGTSPLQNTLNTIFFPMLFHMKVAKFALAGTLRAPEVANAIGQLVAAQNKWALSPEGQKWHQTPGLQQYFSHLIGSAEPVNIPWLTGRDQSPQQAAEHLVTPYNPLSFLGQGVADVTGLQVPGTQPPTSPSEIKHPVMAALAAGTGLGSVFSQSDKLSQALGLQSPGYTQSLKSIKAEIDRQQKGMLPPRNSVIASLRNFQGSNKLSDVQKMEYARMRANYDFPDDKDKQQNEINYIMRLWRRVKPAKP